MNGDKLLSVTGTELQPSSIKVLDDYLLALSLTHFSKANKKFSKKANDWRTSSVKIDPSVDLGNDSLVYPKVVVCVLSKSQSP